MPKIACPGCQKQYSLPDSAAGKSATCKACGRKFRIELPHAAPARLKPAAKAVGAKQAVAAPVAEADDAFWDDSLPQQAKQMAQPAPRAMSSSTAATATHPALEPKKKSKKKKKKRKIAWGADWGKVGGGLMTFLVAGSLTFVAAITTGRIYFWGVGVAVVGLFTALSGLMGEDGVW